MLKVRVRFSGPLGAHAGAPSAELELPRAKATVADALGQLRVLHPWLSQVLGEVEADLTRHLRVFLNGRGIQFQGGLCAILADGDELLLVLPIGGG